MDFDWLLAFSHSQSLSEMILDDIAPHVIIIMLCCMDAVIHNDITITILKTVF